MWKPAARWHLLGFGDKKPKAFSRTIKKIEKGSPYLSHILGWQCECLPKELIIATCFSTYLTAELWSQQLVKWHLTRTQQLWVSFSVFLPRIGRFLLYSLINVTIHDQETLTKVEGKEDQDPIGLLLPIGPGVNFCLCYFFLSYTNNFLCRSHNANSVSLTHICILPRHNFSEILSKKSHHP